MSALNVNYIAEQGDNGSWKVVKCVAKPNRYGGWMQSDEKKTTLGEGFKKWNAEYAAAALNYLDHKAKAKDKDAVFNADSLDCLKENVIQLEELAFDYVRDTLCSGWALHNAYKLTGAPMIDLWLKGSACRFGFLPLDIEKDVVFEKLADSIDKVIKTYSR